MELLLKLAETLKQYGAKKIVIAATHGIFSKGFDIFENNPAVEKVIITDSIDNDELLDKYKKLEIVSLDRFLGSVIDCSINGKSISMLYDKFAKEIKENESHK
nr:hypothetical protein [Mycoplasmopsis bovis]